MWQGKFLGGSDMFYILVGFSLVLFGVSILLDFSALKFDAGVFNGAAITQATARYFASKYLVGREDACPTNHQ